MASSPECPLCLQPYNSTSRLPRTLPCSHIACTACLSRLSTSHDSVIVCPFDRSECKTLVTELPTATPSSKKPRVEEHLEPSCALCAENHLATHCCIDCGEHACEFMAAAHTRARITQDHRMTPLTDIPAPALCAEHNLELTSYDTQCGVPVCTSCLAHSHEGHACALLKDAAAEWRATLDTEVAAWAERVGSIRELEKAAGAKMQTLDESRTAAEKAIEDTFKELHSLLTARKLSLLDEVASIHKTKSFALSAHIDHLQSIAEGVERAIQDAKEHHRQSDANLLAAKPGILSKIKAAAEDAWEENGWTVRVSFEGAAEDIMKAGAVSAEEQRAKRPPTGWNRIQGIFLRSWKIADETSHLIDGPAAAAVHNNVVFVASYDSIQVFSKEGEELRVIGPRLEGVVDDKLRPIGLAISSRTNEVFLSDFRWGILVFALDGSFLRRFGARGADDGQLCQSKGVALNPQCTELFVCDGGNFRVQVLSPIDGAFLRKWGSQGSSPGQFQRFMGGITVSRDVQVVCVSDFGDRAGSCPRVQVFTPSGQLLRVLGGQAGDGDGVFSGMMGVAFTKYGTLLVCDNDNCRIQEMDVVDGTLVRKWGRKGEERDEFVYPAGLTVSEEGEVYVCDSHDYSVKVFE